jgi:hypothetical protein
MPSASKFVPLAIAGLAVMAAVLQLFMVLNFEINWDEFFYLGWVYDWRNGELGLVLQTIFLRFFTWLPAVSDNEVTQIVAGRLFMLAGLSASCAMLVSMIRRFYSGQAALLSVLLFVSFSFVFRHATSFRADMILTTLCIMVLWLIMKKHLIWRDVLIAGIVFGLAGMVSIKSIFYAPTISLILLAHWARAGWSKDMLIKSLTMGLVAMLSFAGFYALHYSATPNASSGVGYVSNVAGQSLMDAGFFPRGSIFRSGVIQNIFFWICAGLGFAAVWRKLRQKDTVWMAMASLGFALPLLTIVFYRHAYPYYYPLMLAPLTLLMAAAFDMNFIKKDAKRVLMVSALIAFNFVMIAARSIPQNLTAQKNTVAQVHAIFPTSTAYIDRNDMVSSYPKSGLFMSHWYMANYYRANTPIFADILAAEQPKFLLANIQGLDLDHITQTTQRRLLRTDEHLLQDNYIHHWGPIYVAGKRVDLTPDTPINISIIIKGPYTVESPYPVQINGIKRQNGDVINLDMGPINVRADHQTKLVLRWGNNLHKPHTPPPHTPLFNGF